MAEITSKQPYVSLVIYKAKYANFKPKKAYLVVKSNVSGSDVHESAVQVAERLNEADLANAKLFVYVWQPSGRLKSASCVKSFEFDVNSLICRHARADDKNLHINGPLEIFVEATGPQQLYDRLKQLQTVDDDDLEQQENLLALLEDLDAIATQGKHKMSTYITEETIKSLSDVLIKFAPFHNLDDDNEQNGHDDNGDGENAKERKGEDGLGRKEKRQKDSTSTSSATGASKGSPKGKNVRNENNDKKKQSKSKRRQGRAADDSDDDDDAESENDSLLASSSSLASPKSRSTKSKRSEAAEKSNNPPKRSRASASRRRANSTSSEDSDTSESSSGDEAERLLQASEERSKKLREIRIKIRKIIVQIFLHTAESDISLVRKLISAKFLARMKKLLRSKVFDEETHVALLNCLKPFFVVRSHQKSLFEAGILSVLIKFVSRPAKQIGGLATQYAAFDLLLYFDEMYQKELLNAGVLSAALRLLGTGTPQIRTRALELLSFFNRNYQEELINEGIFTQIISLLNLSDYSTTSNKAILSSLLLRSLHVVSLFDSKHHDGLVEAGLFKRLIGLLELKDDKLQETCLKVLSSFESKYMKELIEANYVDAIVKLLDPTNAASIAVSALVYGTALDFCEQADLRKLLIEAGIIRILTDRVLGVADQAVVGSEMRAVVLYLLSELPLTFKMMQETQLLVALHNTITQVFRVDLFLYAGAWSAIWRRKDPNLVPNISIISLSLDLINQILEMPEWEDEYSLLIPHITALAEALPRLGAAEERQVLHVLLRATKSAALRKILVEDSQLVQKVLSFAQKVGDTDLLERIPLIPEWQSNHGTILELSNRLVSFLCEEGEKGLRLARSALTLLRLIDRSLVASFDNLALIKTVFQKNISADICCEFIKLLSEICSSPDTADRVADSLQSTPPVSIASRELETPLGAIIKFASSTKEATEISLTLLENIARANCGLYSVKSSPIIAKFLTSLLVPSVQEGKPATVSSSIVTPASATPFLSSSSSSSMSSSTSMYTLSSSGRTRFSTIGMIGYQRSGPKLVLGSARERSISSVPTLTDANPDEATPRTESDTYSFSLQTDMRSFHLLLRVLATENAASIRPAESKSAQELLKFPTFFFSNLSIYTDILGALLNVFENAPSLSPIIQDALISLVKNIPEEHKQAFLDASLVEKLIHYVSTFQPSPEAERFSVELILALQSLGPSVVSSILRFVSNIEAFQSICMAPQSPRLRTAACEWFSSMSHEQQSEFIDSQILSFFVHSLQEETKKFKAGTLQGVSSKEALDALQHPVVELVSKLDDKFFLSLTHKTNPEALQSASTSTLDAFEEHESINVWLGKALPWKIIYQASKDGWTKESFFEHCKGCGPNLVIAKTTTGSVFGGYTSLSWQFDPNTQGGYLDDPEAFLFALKGAKSAPVKCDAKKAKSSEAIYVSASSVGPTFGAGHDLVIDLAAQKHRGTLGYTYTLPPGQHVVTSTFFDAGASAPLEEVYVFAATATTPARAISSSSAPVIRVDRGPKLLRQSVGRLMSLFIDLHITGEWDAVYEDEKEDDQTNDGDGDTAEIGENEPIWELLERIGPGGSTSKNHVKVPQASQPLLIIVKLTNGAVFGGYTSINRTNLSVRHYVADPAAFLFSLRAPAGPAGSRRPTVVRPHTENGSELAMNYSIILTEDGIGFGQGMDLFINFSKPHKSFSNLGVSYGTDSKADDELVPFSQAATTFLAGSPSGWEIANIELYTPLPTPQRKLLAQTKKVFGNMRLLFYLMSTFNTASLADLVNNKFQHLLTDYRSKVVVELNRVLADPTEPMEVKNVLRPHLVAAKLPNLKVAPYKILSIGGHAYTQSSSIEENNGLEALMEPSDSWKNEYTIARPLFIESPGNILLEYCGLTDFRGSIPYLTHFLVGVDILGGDEVMGTVPAKRVLIFASDEPFDESLFTDYDNPLVAMGVEPDEANTLGLEGLTKLGENKKETIGSSSSGIDLAEQTVPAKPSEESNMEVLTSIAQDLDALFASLEGLGQDSEQIEIPEPPQSSSSTITIAKSLPRPIATLRFGIWSYDEAPLKEPIRARYLLVKVLADPAQTEKFESHVCINAFAAVAYLPKIRNTEQWPLPDPESRCIVGLRQYIGPSSIFHEKTFTFRSDFDQGGLVWWLGTNMGATDKWENPAISGKIQLKLSHPLYNATTMRASDALAGYSAPAACFWGGSVPTWCTLDLGNVSINLTDYSLRHGYNYANSFIHDWRLEGSNDCESWELLHEQLKSPYDSPHAKASFSIVRTSTCTGAGKYFRFLRIWQKGHYFMGVNSQQKSAPFLCINGIELYGTARFEENFLVDPPLFAERFGTLVANLETNLTRFANAQKGKEKDKVDE